MNYTQLGQDITFLLTGSSTGTVDFSAADILSEINNAYNKVVSLIMRADNSWQWDDNNFTTLPVAHGDLISGQADYEITSASFLNIIKVEVKDADGNSISVDPIDYGDKKEILMDEGSGTPHSYDKVGNSIVFYPTPNYSSTFGATIHFQRLPSYFVISDNNKEPGFSPLFHRLLSLYSAYDYCLANGLSTKLQILGNEQIKMENALIEYYGSRTKDITPHISFHKETLTA